MAATQPTRDEATSPYEPHFEHCYVYEGSFCSCGGTYTGDQPGPRLEAPPAPFNLLTPNRASG